MREIVAKGELSDAVSRQCLEFLRLTAESSSTPLSDDEVVAFHTAGSLLASHVRYLTQVVSITTRAWGHELAFTVMRGGRSTERDDSRDSWAAITTILPEVSYHYSLFKDAMTRASRTTDDKNWPASMSPHFLELIVPESDFEQIVRFRRDELRRVIRLFDRSSWLPQGDDDNSFPEDLYYRWPQSWGKVPFNMPVTGHRERPLLPDVADDLLRAEEAVRRPTVSLVDVLLPLDVLSEIQVESLLGCLKCTAR